MNVPLLGGEQMYEALKSLGRPTELVVYPGSSWIHAAELHQGPLRALDACG